MKKESYYVSITAENGSKLYVGKEIVEKKGALLGINSKFITPIFYMAKEREHIEPFKEPIRMDDVATIAQGYIDRYFYEDHVNYGGREELNFSFSLSRNLCGIEIPFKSIDIRTVRHNNFNHDGTLSSSTFTINPAPAKVYIPVFFLITDNGAIIRSKQYLARLSMEWEERDTKVDVKIDHDWQPYLDSSSLKELLALYDAPRESPEPRLPSRMMSVEFCRHYPDAIFFTTPFSQSLAEQLLDNFASSFESQEGGSKYVVYNEEYSVERGVGVRFEKTREDLPLAVREVPPSPYCVSTDSVSILKVEKVE
jgi:hypothetical protein